MHSNYEPLTLSHIVLFAIATDRSSNIGCTRLILIRKRFLGPCFFASLNKATQSQFRLRFAMYISYVQYIFEF